MRKTRRSEAGMWSLKAILATLMVGLAGAGSWANEIKTSGSQQAAPVQLAQANTVKAAYEEAKALGTIEGWEAFLALYPSEPESEFARAYLKLLERRKSESKQTQKPAEAPKAPANTAPAKEAKAPPSGDISEREIEVLYWKEVKDSGDVELLQSYLAQYPVGSFAPLAKLRIASLQKAAGTNQPANDQAAAAPPPGADDAPEMSAEDLAGEVQSELQRIGCTSDEPDGKWGPRSRQALNRYAVQTNTPLKSLQPSQDLLQKLSVVEAGACSSSSDPVQVRKKSRKKVATTNTRRNLTKKRRNLRKNRKRVRTKRRVKRRVRRQKRQRRRQPSGGGGGPGFFIIF